MSKIPVNVLIADFQRMWREHWAYNWSAAEQGKVSCSGAFTWAYRQHGHDIYQGSNRIARVYVDKLIPIEEARAQGLILPGMAAFKMRRPGDKNYALPASYQRGGKYNNGDLNDYYHIGLVDEDAGYVLNAQSAATGFVRSQIKQNWSHVGFLKDVEYERSGETMTAKVTGGKLNMRKTPEKGGTWITSIPNGQEVEVLEKGTDWTQVHYIGREGYVMTKYLIFDQMDDLEEQMDQLNQEIGKGQLLLMLDHAEQNLAELRRLIENM